MNYLIYFHRLSLCAQLAFSWFGNKKSLVIFVPIMLLTMVGCSVTQHNNGPTINGLLLTEPEVISPRSQIAIAHYTNTLFQMKMTPEERAEILFQRGIAYDSMGLTSLARMDYSEAIKLNPQLAEAHNSIGVHYIQAGMYMHAYEAFDSTLEINPDYDFALLNRGIALYYGGRESLATIDTLSFLEKDNSDPIRVLWHFIASNSSRDNTVEQSLNMLKNARKNLSDDKWATVLVDYYLGQASETQVIARLIQDVRSQTELNYRLCEAYFYLGKYQAKNGNLNLAENYFKLSLSTNVYEYVEHKYARIELDNIRRTRTKNTP